MIGIVTAMEKEASPILNNLKLSKKYSLFSKTIYECIYLDVEIVLIVSGIGKVNAAYATTLLCQEYKIDLILNIGICGAINENCLINNIYLVSAAVQYDFDLSLLNNCEIGKLEEFETPYIHSNFLINNFSKFEQKKLATGDRISNKEEDVNLLRTVLKADLRDMEGCSILQVAKFLSIPCFLFKCVSNNINKTLAEEYSSNQNNCFKNIENNFKYILTEAKTWIK